MMNPSTYMMPPLGLVVGLQKPTEALEVAAPGVRRARVDDRGQLESDLRAVVERLEINRHQRVAVERRVALLPGKRESLVRRDIAVDATHRVVASARLAHHQVIAAAHPYVELRLPVGRIDLPEPDARR